MVITDKHPPAMGAFIMQERWHSRRTQTTYPPLLGHIHKPPEILYGAGSIETLQQPAVAIIGSRANTPYGKQVCEWLIPPLVQAGLVIISGLAEGIDAHAHRTTLRHYGTTVAVVAHGISTAALYPKHHTALAEDIIYNNGAIVSEYPADVKARRHQFVARNRIVAGMCLATIVIEAREKSGALITADFAMQQGRDVWAVPGSVFSSRSAGTHSLLQQGAMLLESPDTLLEHLFSNPLLNILDVPSRRSSSQASQAEVFTHIYSTEYANSNPTQHAIITALQGQAMQAEDIAKHSQYPTAEVMRCLTELEIAGIVRKNPDFSYHIAVRT